jgi:hypothetical protein
MSETIADAAVGRTADAGVDTHAAGHDLTAGLGGIDYEYATVQAPRRLEWVYRDAYRHLGWVLDAFDPEGCRNPAVVALRFRRDLALPGREQLADLQREGDSALAVISARERVRTSLVHSSTALSGIVGAGLMASAALTLDDGDLLTPILLGTLGVVVWLIGVIGRRHLAEIAAARFGLGIEQEYATVLAVGQEATRLLTAADPALGSDGHNSTGTSTDGLELVPGPRVS